MIQNIADNNNLFMRVYDCSLIQTMQLKVMYIFAGRPSPWACDHLVQLFSKPRALIHPLLSAAFKHRESRAKGDFQ